MTLSEMAEIPVDIMFVYPHSGGKHIFSERMNFYGSRKEVLQAETTLSLPAALWMEMV